jgi:multiple sugar transport system ATP-binding protein
MNADQAQFVVLAQGRDSDPRAHASAAQRSASAGVYVTDGLAEARARGDRIAILRGGTVQQVGTVEQLHRRPANLFVAGLIGSPPINVMKGRLAGDSLSLPFGDVPVPQAFRASLRTRPALRDVIAGVRPEDVTDVRLGHDAGGLRFSAVVAAVEPVGSESYGRLQPGPAVRGSSFRCDPLALVARLDPASDFGAGKAIDVVLDPDRLLLFEPSEGWSLTAAACPRSSTRRSGPARALAAPADLDVRPALMGAGQAAYL